MRNLINSRRNAWCLVPFLSLFFLVPFFFAASWLIIKYEIHVFLNTSLTPFFPHWKIHSAMQSLKIMFIHYASLCHAIKSCYNKVAVSLSFMAMGMLCQHLQFNPLLGFAGNENEVVEKAKLRSKVKLFIQPPLSWSSSPSSTDTGP